MNVGLYLNTSIRISELISWMKKYKSNIIRLMLWADWYERNGNYLLYLPLYTPFFSDFAKKRMARRLEKFLSEGIYEYGTRLPISKRRAFPSGTSFYLAEVRSRMQSNILKKNFSEVMLNVVICYYAIPRGLPEFNSLLIRFLFYVLKWMS